MPPFIPFPAAAGIPLSTSLPRGADGLPHHRVKLTSLPGPRPTCSPSCLSLQPPSHSPLRPWCQPQDLGMWCSLCLPTPIPHSLMVVFLFPCGLRSNATSSESMSPAPQLREYPPPCAWHAWPLQCALQLCIALSAIGFTCPREA